MVPETAEEEPMPTPRQPLWARLAPHCGRPPLTASKAKKLLPEVTLAPTKTLPPETLGLLEVVVLAMGTLPCQRWTNCETLSMLMRVSSGLKLVRLTSWP